jgi:hypothetical protein
MHVVDVCDDANDALRRPGGSAGGFQHRITPEHVPIDRILIWKHALRERLANDGHLLLVLNIEIVEIATRHDRDAERCKKSGRDYSILRARVLLTG